MPRFYLHRGTGRIHVFRIAMNSNAANSTGMEALPIGFRPVTLEGIGIHTNFNIDEEGNQIGASDNSIDSDIQHWLHDWFNSEEDYLAFEVEPPEDAPQLTSSMENPEHDFPQKYKDTFVLAKTNDNILSEPEVVYIDSIKGRGKNLVVAFSSFSESGQMSYYKDFEIVKSIPFNGFVNTRYGYPVFFSRSADRQWKRGVCSSTFESYPPSEEHRQIIKESIKGSSFCFKHPKGYNVFATMNSGHHYFDLEHIRKLFNPVYPTYQEAINSILLGKAYSIAFADNAYISASPRTKNLVLGIGSIEMGEISPKNQQEILVRESLFHQEIIDLVKRKNLALKVCKL